MKNEKRKKHKHIFIVMGKDEDEHLICLNCGKIQDL